MSESKGKNNTIAKLLTSAGWVRSDDVIESDGIVYSITNSTIVTTITKIVLIRLSVTERYVMEIYNDGVIVSIALELNWGNPGIFDGVAKTLAVANGLECTRRAGTSNKEHDLNIEYS